MDLFGSRPHKQNLHQSFLIIRDDPLQTSAKAMMEALAVGLDDRDGNFVQQFQTTAFDQRTWELYLHTALSELELDPRLTYEQPDFHCKTQGGSEFFVEAVTSARPQTGGVTSAMPSDSKAWSEEVSESHKNHSDLERRLLNKLRNKRDEHYERRAHVTGKALTLAIAQFHDVGSVFRSDYFVQNALYGDPFHNLGGFFAEDGSEHIAAVIFSNSGTAPKFARMGTLQGHKSEERLLHVGCKNNPDLASPQPEVFSYFVGDRIETWREGLSAYYNPQAINMLPIGTFEGCLEVYADANDVLDWTMPGFHPYASATYFLHEKRSS